MSWAEKIIGPTCPKTSFILKLVCINQKIEIILKVVIFENHCDTHTLGFLINQ